MGKLLRSLFDPLFVIAIAAGTYLRLDQLSDQIIADDEWHGLAAALEGGFFHIFTHFGSSDHCIPLSLFYEACSRFWYLDEIFMRLPSLMAGLALLVIAPVWAGLEFGRSTRNLLAWLLALSPLEIYYTQYGRPYSIVALLTFVAGVSFLHWWKTGERRSLLLYTITAALSPWFTLSCAAFVLSPFLYAAGQWAVKGLELDKAKDLAISGCLIVVGYIVLLGPPLWLDGRAVTDKLTGWEIGVESFLGLASLFTGTAVSWLILLCFGFILSGCYLLWGKDRTVVEFLAVATFFQIGTVISLQPIAGFVPIVLARYSIALHLFLLLFLAYGLNGVEEVIRRLAFYRKGLISGIFILNLFLLGPIREVHFHPNAFINHGLFQYSYSSEDRYSYSNLLKPWNVPQFYVALGASGANRGTVLEVPWFYEWHSNLFPYYQQVHQQRMKIGFVGADFREDLRGEISPPREGFQFKNFVALETSDGVEKANVDWVVFHRSMDREIPNSSPRKLVYVDKWISRFRKKYGQPIFEDSLIVVFGTSPLGKVEPFDP